MMGDSDEESNARVQALIEWLKAGKEAGVKARAAQKQQQQPFQRLLRAAGKPFAHSPWRPASMGLVCHPESGHWGHVVFKRAQLWRPSELAYPVLSMEFVAGAVSPYLFRHWNGLDPSRPPSSNLVANHARADWQPRVLFSTDSDQPEVTWVPGLRPAERHVHGLPPVLGPMSAGPWLTSVFQDLVPKTEALCNDEAILAYLLQTADLIEQKGVLDLGGLRMAALLSRHLGHDEAMPELLERAAAARAACKIAASPRTSHHPGYWSHKYFVQYMNEIPKD